MTLGVSAHLPETWISFQSFYLFCPNLFELLQTICEDSEGAHASAMVSFLTVDRLERRISSAVQFALQGDEVLHAEVIASFELDILHSLESSIELDSHPNMAIANHMRTWNSLMSSLEVRTGSCARSTSKEKSKSAPHTSERDAKQLEQTK